MPQATFSSKRGATAQPHAGEATWHGTAFLVEALLLLAFLVGCIAIFMQLFGESNAKGAQNSELAHAIVLASNSAEQFAANPANAPTASQAAGGYLVLCSVTPEHASAGTLYRAEIVVVGSDDASAQAGAEADASNPGNAAGAGEQAGADAVPDGFHEVYRLSTARYVSEVA